MRAVRAMFAVSVTLATTTSVARPAGADAPPRAAQDVARAEARFHEGEKLFDAKQYAEACAAFDESERLDPQLGTLLNLAFCQETVGKIATAWREYSKGSVWGEQRGQHDRAAWALARAFELSKRLPLALLDMPPGAAAYTIEIDGDAVPSADWATPLPLDPGEHVLRVSAAGRLSQQLVVRVSAGPATQGVTVPTLEPQPAAPPASGDAPTPAPPRGNGQRVVGLVGLGLGVAALGVGTYYGVMTLSKKSDAAAHCVGTECDATGVALQDDAHSYASVSTVAFAVGVATLGVGAWLTWTAPASPSVRATIQPLVGPRIAGLGMVGSW
jgi:hypothetical protein